MYSENSQILLETLKEKTFVWWILYLNFWLCGQNFWKPTLSKNQVYTWKLPFAGLSRPENSDFNSIFSDQAILSPCMKCVTKVTKHHSRLPIKACKVNFQSWLKNYCSKSYHWCLMTMKYFPCTSSTTVNTSIQGIIYFLQYAKHT